MGKVADRSQRCEFKSRSSQLFRHEFVLSLRISSSIFSRHVSLTMNMERKGVSPTFIRFLPVKEKILWPYALKSIKSKGHERQTDFWPENVHAL